jgi:predicted CoA-binding protein
MSWQNPDDETLTGLLKGAKTIAVYGCSPKPDRTSHQITAFLIEKGYEVYPVHPQAKSILGRKCYATLADIPVHIDIVDVFRKAEFTEEVARQAVEIGAGAFWLQLGIINEESYRIAKEGGVTPIMDLCIAVIHRMLIH